MGKLLLNIFLALLHLTDFIYADKNLNSKFHEDVTISITPGMSCTLGCDSLMFLGFDYDINAIKISRLNYEVDLMIYYMFGIQMTKNDISTNIDVDPDIVDSMNYLSSVMFSNFDLNTKISVLNKIWQLSLRYRYSFDDKEKSKHKKTLQYISVGFSGGREETVLWQADQDHNVYDFLTTVSGNITTDTTQDTLFGFLTRVSASEFLLGVSWRLGLHLSKYVKSRLGLDVLCQCYQESNYFFIVSQFSVSNILKSKDTASDRYSIGRSIAFTLVARASLDRVIDDNCRFFCNLKLILIPRTLMSYGRNFDRLNSISLTLLSESIFSGSMGIGVLFLT